MKNLKVFLMVSFMLTNVVSSISAQDIYKVKTHEVVISGTSNIHDWTATVIDLSGSAQISSDVISDVTITVIATNLKSSKGSIMDGKMQDALKTDDYPNIYYQSVTNKIVSEKNGIKTIATTGKLTISGVTKTITVTSISKTLQNGNVEISGKFDVLMTDFNIEPPTALFGTLTTADKVTITYKIVLEKLK
jgi:polyisoprenoid-binding protein YceI